MVHGGCSSAGCYAIRDHEVEVVYRLVEAALKAGQRQVNVHPFPFRLDKARLARYKGEKWHRFWTMLQPGYDAFEHERGCRGSRSRISHMWLIEPLKCACRSRLNMQPLNA